MYQDSEPVTGPGLPHSTTPGGAIPVLVSVSGVPWSSAMHSLDTPIWWPWPSVQTPVVLVLDCKLLELRDNELLLPGSPESPPGTGPRKPSRQSGSAC